MYISKEKGMVYLAHPKTASQSTKAVLLDDGFVLSDKMGDSRPSKCGSKRTGHHRELVEHPGPEWTVVTTIRNHFDAWVSWWAYSSRDGEEFDPDFIRRIRDRNPMYWPEENLMWGMHGRFADRILRYESIENDISVLLGKDVTLPRKNVSKKRRERPYREFYDGNEETREYIQSLFGDEIQRYGYEY